MTDTSILKLLGESVRNVGSPTTHSRQHDGVYGLVRVLHPAPVTPPVVWTPAPGCLRKCYSFDDPGKCLPFIEALLGYEAEVGRDLRIVVESPCVTVEFDDADPGGPSESDWYHTSQCDAVRRDVESGYRDYMRQRDTDRLDTAGRVEKMADAMWSGEDEER